MNINTLITVAIGLLGLYAGATAFVAIGQKRYIYRPDRRVDGTPEDAGLPYDDARFFTADAKKLHGWFVPATNSNTAAPTVLFCHGNAGDIADRVESLRVFHQMGFNGFVFDYRGYGNSSAEAPSEEGTRRDASAAWKYLTKERGLPPESIAIYGRSLGGAVACQLAGEVTPGCLILESTFASIPAMATKMFPILPVNFFCAYRYDNTAAITGIHVPLLLAHSKADRTCPYHQGRAVFEAANQPRTFVELNGQHNELAFDTTPEYRQVFADFIRRHCGPAALQQD